MRVYHSIPALMIIDLALVAAAAAGDMPALDATKYPQNTPKSAITSIIKAIEAGDTAYWMTWLVTPKESKRITEKYGSLDKAVASHADPKKKEHMKLRCELMKSMLEADKSSEGTTDGVKWVRYHADGKVLQMEEQSDGRWSMNPSVNTE